jgi:hypothetical protein
LIEREKDQGSKKKVCCPDSTKIPQKKVFGENKELLK